MLSRSATRRRHSTLQEDLGLRGSPCAVDDDQMDTIPMTLLAASTITLSTIDGRGWRPLEATARHQEHGFILSLTSWVAWRAWSSREAGDFPPAWAEIPTSFSPTHTSCDRGVPRASRIPTARPCTLLPPYQPLATDTRKPPRPVGKWVCAICLRWPRCPSKLAPLHRHSARPGLDEACARAGLVFPIGHMGPTSLCSQHTCTAQANQAGCLLGCLADGFPGQ